MEELENSWSRLLMAASERADMNGRADIADYLRLRATNDAIRAAGAKWLLDAFVDAAFASDRAAALNIEREEGHTFAHGSSTMLGTRLSIRYGVRCLTVETGWTRLPGHGIMRGAALARANILHFGRSRDDLSLRLAQSADLPQWLTEQDKVFLLDSVKEHVNRLLTD